MITMWYHCPNGGRVQFKELDAFLKYAQKTSAFQYIRVKDLQLIELITGFPARTVGFVDGYHILAITPSSAR